MSIASFYHQQAAQARQRAASELLTQRRARLLQSADRWDEMAREADELDVRTRINAEERRLRPYHETLRGKLQGPTC